MEKLNKKIIGNAVSSYFLVGVSVLFLLNTTKNVNHPFVKGHVKTAFSLHIFLLGALLALHFMPFGKGVYFMNYSLHSGFMLLSGLFIFSAILYGAYCASKGLKFGLGDLQSKSSLLTKTLQQESHARLSEADKFKLIVAHIPLLGFSLHGSSNSITIKNITYTNLIITILIILSLGSGNYSFASIAMLGYIAWCVFHGISIIYQKNIYSINYHGLMRNAKIEIFVGAWQRYLFHNIKKREFQNFHDQIKLEEREHKDMKQELSHETRKLKTSKISHRLLYLPVLGGIIGLFLQNTKKRLHAQNSITLSFIFIIGTIIAGWNSPFLLLWIIPYGYGISQHQEDVYPMPGVHFLYRSTLGSLGKIQNFWKKNNTKKTATFTPGNSGDKNQAQ